MFNLINLDKIKNWYINKIARLLLFFIVIVVVSLTAVYIPYLSFIFSPGLRVFIIFLSFYLLFPLSTSKLVYISIVSICFAFIFTILEMKFMAEPLGELLYLILVFIFINYVKSIFKEKNKF